LQKERKLELGRPPTRVSPTTSTLCLFPMESTTGLPRSLPSARLPPPPRRRRPPPTHATDEHIPRAASYLPRASLPPPPRGSRRPPLPNPQRGTHLVPCAVLKSRRPGVLPPPTESPNHSRAPLLPCAGSSSFYRNRRRSPAHPHGFIHVLFSRPMHGLPCDAPTAKAPRFLYMWLCSIQHASGAVFDGILSSG
jgi:hypothetical protein